MTTAAPARRSAAHRAPVHPAPPHLAGEVVAGLVNDGSADAVARAAVREAEARSARVRFVQVVGSRAGRLRGEADEDATFAAALRALRGRPRVRFAFEVVEGEPGQALVGRSAEAVALVVGSTGHPHVVSEYCRDRARCPVVVVEH
jgi:nucleotide-binding universal stress UspA family protein